MISKRNLPLLLLLIGALLFVQLDKAFGGSPENGRYTRQTLVDTLFEYHGLQLQTRIATSIDDRTLLRPLRLPAVPLTTAGTVAVFVKVNRDGAVIEAYPGVRGSTIDDPGILDAVKAAALRTRFSPEEDAPALQTGVLIYRFQAL